MKIALIRERKIPADRRVAISPHDAAELNQSYEDLEMVVEASPDRVFPNEAYSRMGVEVVRDVGSDLPDCDVLFGVKEVPEEALIPGKTYFFFSHTHKEQEYNRKLLQALVSKGIRMIDYECLEWPDGGRIIGFGRWAGVVGVYNGFLTWGKKFGEYSLKPAYECASFEELIRELRNIEIPNIRIALTGTGRVAGGAKEVLNALGIDQVDPTTFCSQEFSRAVFTCLDNEHIFRRKGSDGPWDRDHFFANHEVYEGIFKPYTHCTDMLVNGMYWEDDMPALFTKEQTAADDFNIKVIADITCDVEGSVPITLRATSIEDPVVAWDPITQREILPYAPDCIDVMAVTNLPTELPADASRDFSEVLSKEVVPLLLNHDPDGILRGATLCEGGKLTEKYSYLQNFIDEKD